MRIGVIGAGAVGGAIAALLARAGNDVEVTARGAHLRAIRESGLTLTGAWGDSVSRVRASGTLSRINELVIVATKAHDAEEAIRENIRFLRDLPVVIFQNGLDSLDVATYASPRSDIIGGLATFASSFLSPGTIHVTAAGPSYLGVAGDNDVPARYAANALNAVMPTFAVSNFRGAQWTKLVINQVNALPAVTGRSVQDVIEEPLLRQIMTASMRETARTALAAGIRFETLQGLSHRRLRNLARSPLWLGQIIPLLMSRRMGRTPNPGSTLQSIRRGQPSEVDALNGAVVRAADELNRAAPLNALMVELVHGVEETGNFLTTEDVAARFAALDTTPPSTR
ncbi:2-dehydropantoate 2-reductase [Salinibacterium sp. NSLL150]|uniref:ketopantoate reductase family protein n=1 Tax=unclassified Salinibacterium TaxID=2632331 RepID=UPI0018CD6C07|nr:MULTISPECIES: 2-dehydropantoate 2-reductase [unclassified Salinibacterium]MBH0100142.1 2-dehydropantoate 2-reductase [Salinibacterium sp. NSLL35]MBH0102896.1 2-dehydropantoate 2-reductase [Salinibacterium sp. NSLL150]MBH0105656.1 2-dehydropantoate 2-reductase [Salinibacterium sp. NSLL16]MBH0108416.1 2-dehydropantoate 2-reductase [Salinibacterium sp. NSLL17]